MPPLHSWRFDQIANAVEAILWLVVAVGFLIGSLRSSARYRTLCWFTSAGFFVFGLTDVAEIITGAWYRPWWLLGLNAACAMGLAAAWLFYRTLCRRSQ